MRHICTRCGAEIVDGAETEWLNVNKWTPCGAGLYDTQPDSHGGTPSLPHRHVKCPTHERWYLVRGSGYISASFSARPDILPGERAIRVAEEYVAVEYVKIKQLWPEE